MKTTLLVVALAGSFAVGAVQAQSGADVVKSKGCLGCHDLEAKKVGPSYKEIATKYKSDKGALNTLTGKLKEGKGHPVKFAGSDAELKAALEYVLSRK